MASSERPRVNNWQRFLNVVGGLVKPAIYGAAVSLTLAMWFAFVKMGDPSAVPVMLKFVGAQFTPFFVLAYHVSGKFLPDKTLRRTSNLLLPAVEGCLAVGFMSAMLATGFEIDDPYRNLGLYLVELLGSVLVARLIVRNVFKH